MTPIAVTEVLDGRAVDWLEKERMSDASPALRQRFDGQSMAEKPLPTLRQN
jgi:hypothetical protein